MQRLSLTQLDKDLKASLAGLRTDQTRVKASRAIVDRALADGNAYYGLNTGFGSLASKRIAPDKVEELQHNILLSHAVGVGDPVPYEISRLMLGFKIHSLGLGYSGISMDVFNRLLDFAEKDLIPVIPSKGSLGASGDLAPLAHLSLPLIGLGFFWDKKKEHAVPAAEALQKAGLKKISLHAKDGLALCNGTQFMCAYGAYVLSKALTLVKYADVISAISFEALMGSVKPFDERVHMVRPFKGQRDVAANMRALLKDSAVVESHKNCGRVQDPYSIRCIPQVHGASRDALAHANSVIETELNSATDNPLVFEDGAVISGGNFHGQPLALALDYAALAIAELASISERRIYLLLSGVEGLPQLLMRDTGVNSGFMIPQYTAAALVSENKVLAHPASVDSIPSSLGQEDHVSMGSISATKLLEIFKNVENVLAIELFTAAQALDYRKPIKPGRGVEAAHEFVRAKIPHFERDEPFKAEIDKGVAIVRSGEMLAQVEKAVGALQ